MDIKQTIRNQTDVGLRITKQLFQTQGKTQNIVYSPLSIHVVLSLIAARLEGSTQDEMLSFLKAQSTDELNSLAEKIVPLVFADGLPGGPCLNFANGLWVEQTLPLMPSFQQVVHRFYKAALKHVDFRNKPDEVRIEVNSWVAKETKGLIQDFLPPGFVESSTVRIFVNALYFKGLWERPFDASRTEESDFNLINGKSPVKAPFMNNSQSYQYVKVFEGFKVLRLMYEQGEDEERKFSMCLFLPDAKDGLPTLVDRVCAEPGFLDGHLPDNRVIALVGDFFIPKFKMTSEFQPSDILQDLGLVLDSKIKHRAVIEVNEQGTEAAAVTMEDEECCCGYDSDYEPPVAIDFVADHPFLFLVREETTGVVLFMGQVLNPLDDRS